MVDDEQFKEVVMNELYRIRDKQDKHAEQLSDLKVDLTEHKTRTSIFATVLGAIAGFLATLFSK